MTLVKDLIISLICNQAANSKKAVVMSAVQAKLVERMQRPVEESSTGVSWSSLRERVESHSKEMGEACSGKTPFNAELESERCSVPFFCLIPVETERLRLWESKAAS